MKEFFEKYIINNEAAMSDEWTDYDAFWSAVCLLVGLVGIILAVIFR